MPSTRVPILQRRASRTRCTLAVLLACLLVSGSVGTEMSAQSIPDGALVIPLKPGNLLQRGRDALLYDGTRLEVLFDPASNGDVYVIVRDLVSLTDLQQGVPGAALELQIDGRPGVRVNLVAVGRGESSRNEQTATVIDAYRGKLSDEEAAALLAASRVRGRVRGLSFESNPSAATPLLANATRRSGADVIAVAGGITRESGSGGRMPPGTGGSPAFTGTAGSPHGANIRIVRDFAFEAPDSVSSKFVEVAESVSNPVAGPACGTSRLCASGWDLRPVAVELPATTVPAGGVVPVTITVENRGAMASAISELQLCFQRNNGYARCEARITNLTLPPIPSAASVRITATARLDPAESSGLYIAAIVDPDQVTSEVNRDNNFLASDALTRELPALQWLQAEAVVLGEERKSVEITMRIRNKSVAARSLAAEVAVLTHYMCGTDGSSPYRFQLPALGPRQTVTVQLIVSHPIRAVCGNTANLRLNVDPDQKLLWGRAHEYQFVMDYEAIRR